MHELLPENYLKQWKLFELNKNKLQEIRLRVGQPLMLTYDGLELEKKEVLVTRRDIEQILEWLCGYGIYAYQEEMAKGYIAIKGGHRVGIGGQVVCDYAGKVTQIKYISSLLIRVSHNVTGIADPLLDMLYRNKKVLSILILSPPGCGKTTLLRDLLRVVSEGNRCGKGQNVSLIDEREEIANTYMGIPVIDVGKRTDVLSGCEKSVAMEMCLRTLGPEVVAVDEIYSEKDLEALKRLKGCGCAILATHHAYSFEEFLEKPFGKEIMQHKLFERFVVLGKAEGKYIIKSILNVDGEEIPNNTK